MSKNLQNTDITSNYIETSQIKAGENCLTSGFLSQLINDFDLDDFDLSRQCLKSDISNKTFLYEKITAEALTTICKVTQKILIINCFRKYNLIVGKIFLNSYHQKRLAILTPQYKLSTLIKLQLIISMKMQVKLSYSLSKIVNQSKNKLLMLQKLPIFQFFNNISNCFNKISRRLQFATISHSFEKITKFKQTLKAHSLIQTMFQIIQKLHCNLLLLFFNKIKEKQILKDKIQLIVLTINYHLKIRLRAAYLQMSFSKKKQNNLIQLNITDKRINQRQVQKLVQQQSLDQKLKKVQKQLNIQCQLQIKRRQLNQKPFHKYLINSHFDIYHNQYGLHKQVQRQNFHKKQQLKQKNSDNLQQKVRHLSFNQKIRKKSKQKTLKRTSKNAKDRNFKDIDQLKQSQYLMNIKYIPSNSKKQQERKKWKSCIKNQKIVQSKSQQKYSEQNRKNFLRKSIKVQNLQNCLKIKINLKKLTIPNTKTKVFQKPIPRMQMLCQSYNKYINNPFSLQINQFKQSMNDIGDFLFLKEISTNEHLNFLKINHQQNEYLQTNSYSHKQMQKSKINVQHQYFNSKFLSQKYIPQFKFIERQKQQKYTSISSQLKHIPSVESFNSRSNNINNCQTTKSSQKRNIKREKQYSKPPNQYFNNISKNTNKNYK